MVFGSGTKKTTSTRSTSIIITATATTTSTSTNNSSSSSSSTALATTGSPSSSSWGGSGISSGSTSGDLGSGSGGGSGGAVEEGPASVLEDGAGYAFKHMVSLPKCELRDIHDASAEKRWGRRHVFQLITADQHVLTLEASSPEDKDAWMHSLDEGRTQPPPPSPLLSSPLLSSPLLSSPLLSSPPLSSPLLSSLSLLSIHAANGGWPRTTAISADLEILRHRLGQVVGLGPRTTPAAAAAGRGEGGAGGEVDKQQQQKAPVYGVAETAKELGGAEMLGVLYKHTSTDEWKPLWFILKHFVLYVFKRKPEPHDR